MSARATWTFVYDSADADARRAVRWAARVPWRGPTRWLPRGAAIARRRLLGIDGPTADADFAAIAPDGRVWLGGNAYAVLLWRLKPYAAVADRLAALPNREVARQVVAALARPRGFVGRRLAVAECEARRLIEAEEAADANGATAAERHDDV